MVRTDVEAGADAERGELSGAGAEAVVWVDAAPFRAHLAHVMAVGDMSVDVVAAMAGVSSRAARHLLRGRGGRPVRRISAATGRRLLQITSCDARTVRQRLIPARGALRLLGEIRATGLGLGEVARRTTIDEDLLVELVEGRRDVCSPLLAAQLAAVHIALDAGPEADAGPDADAETDAGGAKLGSPYPLAS